MDIRIFKLISGELVIGQLKEEHAEGSRLSAYNIFTVETPFIIAHGPQGFGLVNMLPWTDVKSGALCDFRGEHVMGEIPINEASMRAHGGIIEGYRKIVSPIVIASADQASGLRLVTNPNAN